MSKEGDDVLLNANEHFSSPSRKRKMKASFVKSDESPSNENESRNELIVGVEGGFDDKIDETNLEQTKNNLRKASNSTELSAAGRFLHFRPLQPLDPLGMIRASSPSGALPKTMSSSGSGLFEVINDSRNLRCRRSSSRVQSSPFLEHRSSPLLCCSSDDGDACHKSMNIGLDQRRNELCNAFFRSQDALDDEIIENGPPLSSKSLNDIPGVDGNESDYSAVAGRMSDLNVGKRGSSFTFKLSKSPCRSPFRSRSSNFLSSFQSVNRSLFTDENSEVKNDDPASTVNGDFNVLNDHRPSSPSTRSPLKRRARLSDSWNQKKVLALCSKSNNKLDPEDSKNLVATIFRNRQMGSSNVAPPPSPANFASPKFGAFGSVLLDQKKVSEKDSSITFGIASCVNVADEVVNREIVSGEESFLPSPQQRLSAGRHSKCRSPDGSSSAHVQAMGDLGTPVTEVGSPAIFHDMEDILCAGEEDEFATKMVHDEYMHQVRSDDINEDSMANPPFIQRKLWGKEDCDTIRGALNRSISPYEHDEDMKAYDVFASKYIQGNASTKQRNIDFHGYEEEVIPSSTSYNQFYESIASTSSARSSPYCVDETTGISQSMFSAMNDSLDQNLLKNFDDSSSKAKLFSQKGESKAHSTTQNTSCDDSGSVSFISARSGLASSSMNNTFRDFNGALFSSAGRPSHDVSNEQVHFRPLPDQSAFESSMISAASGYRRETTGSPFSPSLVCPPTPQRDATTHHGISSREDAIDTFDEGLSEKEESDVFSFGSLRPPSLMRQSSLLDNKLLLSQIGSDSDLIGKRFSFHRDFDHLGLIGSGTFADVYLVRMKNSSSASEQTQQDDGEYFAVKRSKRKFRSKKEREWLMAEVRTMKLIGERECPYVVPFVRAWQEESHFYVQMGFAERGTLKDILNHIVDANPSPIPDSVIWHVVHDVGAGLQLIHQCGFVHLDIKPANLLVSAEGRIQIGDFGMVAAIGSKEDGHEGDTRYMAAELLNNSERMASADMFSLGITLYEMCRIHERGLSGHHHTTNFRLPSEGATWRALREGCAEKISHARLESILQLINALMSPDVSVRPSAFELLQMPEVQQAGSEADPTIMGASCLKGNVAQPRMARSVSFNPVMIESIQNMETSHHSSSSSDANSNLTSLQVPLASDNQIDYAALGDRATTPALTPRNND